MKIKTKRICTALTATVMTAALAAGTGLLVINNRTALADADESKNYFYSKLGADEQAKKFYSVFETLDNNGEFKKGKIEYDLVGNGIVTGGDVGRYVNDGNKTLPYSLGGGRDSYLMDHPDLFYIEIYGTSLSAGSMGSNYAAYLDSSRTDTLYLGSLNTEAKINAAITEYNKAVDAIVTEAKKKDSVKEQIEYVNDYIATNTVYSFGTELKDGKNVETAAAAYISTSYGALVNKEAICGGYAKAFKAVMDRLDIPCVCVQGYAQASSASAYEPHMWNYVQLEDMWYAVDVTYNSASPAHDEYLFMGSEDFFVDHQEDNIISTSNYELQYPALKPYNYGVDGDSNGMGISGEYEKTESSGTLLTLTVNYEDKSAQKLEEEGKYLAFRYGDIKDGKIVWGYWFNFIKAAEPYALPVKFNETNTQMVVYASTNYIQFALINREPDESFGADNDFCYGYSPEKFDEDKDYVVKPSSPYANAGYGSYIAAPWGNPTPHNGGKLSVDKTYEITITYTESLKLLNADLGYGMDVTSKRGNDTIKESCKIENLKWDGDKVISFTFTPSKMYIHNATGIYFTPTNLIGVTSGKVPTEVRYAFAGKTVVCSKVFNDGRLYMQLYGQPEILASSDLSVTNFQDENGNYYAENQRSQLILVASKPDEERQKVLDETLISDETKLEKDDIVTSATYEIDLTLCGCVTKVPNGTYMQVAFGFPEGYDPSVADTTFKIYHYKHDNKGNIIGIEEIPLIVTEYGLIARVTSFSPFTIVQVKNTSAAVTESTAKNVYAYVNGKGGTVKTDNGEGGIVSVAGDSVKYVITKDNGFDIASVYLNGKLIDASKYADGTLTLSKDELNSDNTLEVTFINSESAKSYADKNMTLYTPSGMDGMGSIDSPSGTETPKDHTTVIIVMCVVIGIAVIAGVAVAVVLLKKKKSE